MPLLMNATTENVTLKVAGNYFTFTPGQTKVIHNPEIAHFIATERKQTGIVVLPPQFDDADVEFLKSPEAEELREAARVEGLKHFLDHHRAVINNNQVSMRRDLKQSNIELDSSIMMSPGEIESLKMLAKYKRAQKDADEDKSKEINKLLKEIE